MSLIARLQRRYILEGDTLAQEAELCISELIVALRKIADSPPEFGDSQRMRQTARDALAKCAEG